MRGEGYLILLNLAFLGPRMNAGVIFLGFFLTRHSSSGSGGRGKGGLSLDVARRGGLALAGCLLTLDSLQRVGKTR